MFTSDEQVTTYLTPQDHVASLLAALIDSATSSVRFIIYGATHPLFFAALDRAHQRGVDVKGIFDHTQACGRTEAKMLLQLFQTVPPQHFRIGTSEEAHQIVHLKGCWTDQATVWSGSWNFSPDAEKQVNHVDITTNTTRAQAFQSAFDTLWTFIDQHEPSYQRAAS